MAVGPHERAVVSLSGSALVLWELLEEPIDLHEAAGLMAEFYGVATDEVVAALAPVLDDLAVRKIVDEVPTP